MALQLCVPQSASAKAALTPSEIASGSFGNNPNIDIEFHVAKSLSLSQENNVYLYDVASGRRVWLSPDPIEEGGLNLYAYAGGDPTNYLDPLGLEEWRLDLHDHGGAHIQTGDQRWDAVTFEPIEHKGKTPPKLTKNQIEELRKKGILDKIIKDCRDGIVKEAIEECGVQSSRNLARGTARKVVGGILRRIPVVAAFFIASDYAEGGVNKAARNAIIPGDLIDDTIKGVQQKYGKFIDSKQKGFEDYLNRRAGIK